MTDEEDLRRRIGQLLVFGFDGLTVPEYVADLIRTHYLGNIILFSRNVSTKEQLSALTDHLQSLAQESGQEMPLTISADQENGIVRRLPEDIPVFPGNMALGATHSPEDVYRSGVLTGRLLANLGINFDLAPVLDVNNNPANPVIGVRSLGDVAETVAELGVRFMQGLQSQGIIACGKHFPGHGDTNVDSHLDLPSIAHDRLRLESVELVPFKAAIQAGIDSIMTAHVVFPAVEPEKIPATLSYRVLTSLLRYELGFAGVLTTDCLEMNAISATVGIGAGAVQALRAGADMVMVSHHLDRQLAAIDAIVSAVRQGDLAEARIEEAYQRVQALKAKRLGATAREEWAPLLQAAKAVQVDLSQHAVTALRLTPAAQPTKDSLEKIAVLVDETTPLMAAAGGGGHHPLIKDALATVFPGLEVQEFLFPSVFDCQSEEQLSALLAQYDAVLAGINGTRNTRYLEFVKELAARPIRQATLLLRSPYDALHVKDAPNLYALYEDTPWMAEAAIRSLFGEGAQGRLPVHISEDFPRGYRV
ncbi:beta-hexosaminidase precursor [Peptococcaceae bacterium CEB3]|nr:beta-hexosaminidase precursor [Peptococcaceae bacterium CEB3]